MKKCWGDCFDFLVYNDLGVGCNGCE